MRNHPSQRLAVLGSQTAIIHRPVQMEDRGEAPLGRWRKIVAFVVGATAAMSLNVFLGPRSAASRSSATSRQTDLASSSQAVTPSTVTTAPERSVVPSGVEASPSPGTRDSAGAPAGPRPFKRAKEHKASRSTKRHPVKRRGTSRR